MHSSTATIQKISFEQIHSTNKQTMLLAEDLVFHKFHNLVILICHLFASGEFQFVHILYNSNVFNSNLRTEIDKNCSIPWMIYDLTSPELPKWNYKQKATITFYRLFFPATINRMNNR